jgi:predicted GNAT superfamily acetyltransferase
MSDITIRDLTTIDEFREVVALEKAIWGYTDEGDLVTVPVFIFTVHRGATLVGAFHSDPSTPPAPSGGSNSSSFRAGGRMVGFAYAVVGMKNGKPMMWSHMAGVLPEFRGGLGFRLKLAQRERALTQGYDLIEWTFDPLQAMNAHFNFAKLGGVVEEYAPNFYGESTSALHRGTPTDRVVLSWRITEPHVVRRLERAAQSQDAVGAAMRAHDVTEAPIVNTTVMEDEWRKTAKIDLTIKERRLWIEIPTGFTEMQQRAPERALAWRMDVRQMFDEYLAKGYRAVDFVLQREAGFGRYLLARD